MIHKTVVQNSRSALQPGARFGPRTAPFGSGDDVPKAETFAGRRIATPGPQYFHLGRRKPHFRGCGVLSAR